MSGFGKALAIVASLSSMAVFLGACGGGGTQDPDATAFVFLSPSEVSVAPGQSIQVQVDIANLPTGENASGYAISLSEEATRIRIDSTACAAGAGTASCRLWTIRPDADAAPGDYAFNVRASGTTTPAFEADARIRVVSLAVSKRAVVSASAQHVVTADGRLWARGANDTGQTGVGFTSVGFDADAPFVLPDFIDAFVQVGTDTDWRMVVSAGRSAIALKQDDTVWGWGENPEYEYSGPSANPAAFYHQFGLPSERNLQLTPRRIPGLTDIVAISALDLGDSARFLALARDGRLYGFGGGVDPQYDLRMPNTLRFPSTDAPLPVPRIVQKDGTQTPLTGVRAIAGGVRNSGNGWAVALLENGSVMQLGRLGGTFFRLDTGPEGVKPLRAMPFAVSGLPVNAISVTVGRNGISGLLYSLAATQDGSVWSWTEDDAVPQRITGFSDPIVELDANGSEITALDRTGGLWRWYFGTTAPARVSGVPAMAHLGHRGPGWSISADCASPARGALWSAAGQRVGFFGEAAGGDGCARQPPVVLSLGKIGSGTISIDPVDGPLSLLCDVGCSTTVSVPAGRRDAFKVRATAAPGWYFGGFNEECSGGAPLLEVDTACVATFRPYVPSGPLGVQLSGPGRVTSSPAGIDCGSDCSESYQLGAVIQLTATPAPGYAFLRWSGTSNTSERDCRDGRVTMNLVGSSSDTFPLKECVAVFGPMPRLSVKPSVGGKVTSAPVGIDCGTACSQAYAAGTVVALTAVADAGYRFDGFVESECSVPIALTRDVNCTPTFTATAAGLLTVIVAGNGSVSSTPPGIDCGSHCSEAFPPGATVTLAPVAGTGTRFVGWTGDADCADGVVLLDSVRSCIATFVPAGWQQLGDQVASGNTQRMSIAVDLSVATMPSIVAATAVLTAGRFDLLVRRFDGNAWVLVGSGPINADSVVSSEVFTPAIAIDGGGRISVAWAENGRQLRVKRWEGGVWTTLAEDLRVDAQAMAFGTQIETTGSNLLVAWLESSGNAFGIGRMAMKRYGPAAPTWPGGSVLPGLTNVTALRLSTEAGGNALLMFASHVTTGTLEGPLRVLREGTAGDWTDVCDPLTPPAGSSSTFNPNAQIGFGIARLAAPASDPVAVFNNGEAIFALKCHGTVWTSLDGSAQGQVAAAGAGEALWGLAVAEGEGSGGALAWSRVRFPSGGGSEFLTQVMVENASSTALVASGDELLQDSASAFGYGALTTLAFAGAGSPVLSGLLTYNGAVASRVFRYVP